MDAQELLILVEGNDDERFFKTLVLPRLEAGYDRVDLVKYANQKKEDINKVIHAHKEGGGMCMFFADMNSSKCIRQLRQKLVGQYPALDAREVIIAKREIESWYLAGLTPDTCEKLRIKWSKSLLYARKETLNALQSPSYTSRAVFLQVLMKHFDWDAAKRNSTFAYLTGRLDL
jgi:hypothetical protein